MQSRSTIPQSIAKIKKATLTPHFNITTLQQFCEQSKTELFQCCRTEDIQLIFSENYYEPYLFLTGRYTLDYSKKHSLTVELDEKIDKLYIAGKEFFSNPTDSEKGIFEIPAEQRAHIQRETSLILDRKAREVDNTAMPLSIAKFKKLSSTQKCQKLEIPTKVQIELLKSKIATHYADTATVKQETFEITNRIIVYVPMCRFTYENIISRDEASASINRVTGEIDSITYKTNRNTICPKLLNPAAENAHITSNLPALEKQTLPSNNASFIEEEIAAFRRTQSNIIPEISLEGVQENMVLGFPAEIGGEFFSVGDNTTAVVGDIKIASGSIIDKSLVVKGSVKIGDNCLADGNLKALRDVVVGSETVINGDIIAGGCVFIGALSTVKGRIEAGGFVRISEGASVEKGLHCFSDELEYDMRNLERLRAEIKDLKAECAELSECLKIGMAAMDN